LVPTVLFVSVIVVAVTTLALASPPDPVWIGGLWDDADYDDVVILAICSLAIVGPPPMSDPARGRAIIDVIPFGDETSVSAPTPSANQTRAPPA